MSIDSITSKKDKPYTPLRDWSGLVSQTTRTAYTYIFSRVDFLDSQIESISSIIPVHSPTIAPLYVLRARRF